LVRIDRPGDAPKTVCEPADAQFIWAIVPDGDGLFLATGPNGAVFKVDASGTASPFAELGGDNVLCLTTDKTHLYAGTDREALVYKIDRATAKPYVLYDAAETEVAVMAWDHRGNLLVATGQPTDGAPELNSPDPVAPAKRPAGVELPSKRPTPPKPPDNKPGDAIPHSAAALLGEFVPTTGPSKPDLSAFDAAESDSPGSDTNAVYRIDPRGLVTEIFRKPVTLYGMAVRGDSVLLSTGDDGEVYELRPDVGEEAVLLRTDAPDVTGLLSARDGSLYVATSNAGQIYKMSAGYATSGTFDSDVLDATVPSPFGQMHLLGTIPPGTTLTVQTRAGNVRDPENGDWADWTAPQPATAFAAVTSSAARYLQYRLTFSSTDAAKSAVVDEVDVAYQKPNLPPKLTAVTALPGDTPGQMTLAWDGNDGNDDELRFGLFVRGVGQGTWMKIAEDLTDTTHPWNARGVADGPYEVRVVASDARANPPGEGREVSRVSDAVLIDNTPPAVGDVQTKADGGKMTITFRVVDRSGTVAGVETTLDRIDHWQKQLPDDKMADSPEERYTVPLSGLESGSHTLMIRATDARGNASFETVAVTVP
jgi:outer membrane protein assembly factor BamB